MMIMPKMTGQNMIFEISVLLQLVFATLFFFSAHQHMIFVKMRTQSFFLATSFCTFTYF